MTLSKYMIDFCLDIFHKQGEQALVSICNCTVPSNVFLEKYKKLPPVESMSEKDKLELKQYVIALFPGKPVEELVRNAKIIYTIGNLL